MKQRTYLAASAAGALGVLNGHRPLIRRGWASVPAFMAGWFDTEVPLVRLAAHGGLTAAAARSGLLRTRVGKAATVLNAASAAGLVHLHRLGRRTDAVLETALVDELGSDYRPCNGGTCRSRSAPNGSAMSAPTGATSRTAMPVDGTTSTSGDAPTSRLVVAHPCSCRCTAAPG
jgi:hypothetical protein